ncbi:hypothetical protein [Sphingobacterium micropteri]|nr:hypothetical protein [Sphingobacterium micropteri]
MTKAKQVGKFWIVSNIHDLTTSIIDLTTSIRLDTTNFVLLF